MGTINRFIPVPVLCATPLGCAALGAAAGFYFLFYASIHVKIIFMLILLVTLCFFRVLSSLDTLSRNLQLTAVCSAALAAGFFFGINAAGAGRGEVNFGIPVNSITAVEGILQEDPRIISGGRAMVLLSMRRSAGAGGLRAGASGEITVFFPDINAERLKQFGRGAAVFTEGSLRSTDRGWTFSAQSLHMVKPAPALERMRTNLRLSLISRFEKENWGGLALALLLGIRDNLDSGLAAMYREAGLSYILALSGMHLAILAALIAFLLKKPLGLKMSVIAGAIIIILYCLLVGPMPSLNRAALMYVLGAIAILGALPKKAMSILSLSFLIQIAAAPEAGNSLSFILSYLAMLGILITGKALSSLLTGIIPDFILQPLAISCGAFLATAGVCSFSFGMIAPAGIIASLAIVPLTTVFMIGSIIWLVLDFISISVLLSLPLSLLYRLMEIIASITGSIPRVFANPSLILVISVVLSLGIAALEYKKRAALLKLTPFL